jgi:epoxyqueuosine reductase
VPFPDLLELLLLTEPAFEERFRGTTVRRSGRARLARNAAVALGNQGNRAAVPGLTRALQDDPSPWVRGASAWALARLGGRMARLAVGRALARERDPAVLEELQTALAAMPAPVGAV